MQLIKMSTGITPAKRKKIVPLSSVLDMLEDSPSKRPRISKPEIDTKTPEKVKPKQSKVRRALSSTASEDEDCPAFQIRSFYNSSRNRYLSPIQRKHNITSVESMQNQKVLSKSAGPKLPSRSNTKIDRSVSKLSRVTKDRKIRKVKQRLTMKEKIQGSVVNSNNKVEKSSPLPTKSELTCKIILNTTSSLASTLPICKIIDKTNNSPYEYDFEDALTWDVENLTPASAAKKFFKNRPSPDAAQSPKLESSTSLVVQKGFKLKFLHHRGERSASDTTMKRNSLPEKMSTPPAHKNRLSCPQRTDDDDAMIKKLREELMKESETDEFAFVSSSDESVGQVPDERQTLSSEAKSKSKEYNDTEMTPDLFSQSPVSQGPVLLPKQTVNIEETITITEKKTPPSSDSACHTGQSESTKISQEMITYSRESPIPLSKGPSSPSTNSDFSSNAMDDTESVSSDKSGPSQRRKLPVEEKDAHKYFPIFSQRSNTPKTSAVSKIFKSTDSLVGRKRLSGVTRGSPTMRSAKDNMEQMIIDAGQTRLGASQCDVCGMIYTTGETTDEAVHAKFHQHLLTALRFPGWKKERVLQEYPEGGRVILVTPEDPKYAVKKIKDINKIMAEELGFSESSLSFQSSYKVFLYISDEQKVVGCCVAEPVSRGYRVIPDTKPSSGSTQSAQRPWCCETTPSPAAVGISRIWVYRQNRRQGIATRLLDTVRHWFEYGSVIDKGKVAFSDPTPDGKQLGAMYTGKQNFLVYKYNAM